MAGAEKTSREYRRFWRETADCVLNLVLGTPGGSYGDRLLLHSDGMGGPYLRGDLQEYGLTESFVLKMAVEKLRAAKAMSAPTSLLQDGFAVDGQGVSYSPGGKAEAVYGKIFQEIHRDLSTYRLDLNELLELCGMTYERESAEASLAFFLQEKNPPGVKTVMELDEASQVPFERTRLREIRKLLAGVSRDECLLFTLGETGKYICRGYAILNGVRPPGLVSLYGRRGGLFSAGGVPRFRLSGNKVLVPEEPYKLVWRELCRELGLAPAAYKGIFRALSRQSKGAAVVFVDLGDPVIANWYGSLAAYGRAWKLRGVPAVNLNRAAEEQIRALSRIDGALVVDTDSGELAYAGAILDALGITEGLRDRGARGNGILSHISNLAILGGTDRPMGAAVYSEDGMIMPVLGSAYTGRAELLAAASRHPICGNLRGR